MTKRAKPDQKATNIIFSYVPLLRGPAGSAFLGEEAVKGAQAVAEHMEELPSGAAKACIWELLEDESPRAIFAVDEAKAVAEHLLEWSEGKPEDWFSFHYLEKGEAYATVLMPNFLKSAERWKIAFQLRYGYPPFVGGESHFFRPIHSVAPTKKAFTLVKPYLTGRDKIHVGLVEASTLVPEKFAQERASLEVHELGQFKLVHESKKGMAYGWLDDVIDNMRKEMRS